MPSQKIQNLKGGVFLESKNTQQYEGTTDITFKVTLKSWQKYYVILLSEEGSTEQVEITDHTPHLAVINRYYAGVIANIQETDLYELVGYVSGAVGSYERAVLFKRKDPIKWEGNV